MRRFASSAIRDLPASQLQICRSILANHQFDGGCTEGCVLWLQQRYQLLACWRPLLDPVLALSVNHASICWGPVCRCNLITSDSKLSGSQYSRRAQMQRTQCDKGAQSCCIRVFLEMCTRRGGLNACQGTCQLAIRYQRVTCRQHVSG